VEKGKLGEDKGPVGGESWSAEIKRRRTTSVIVRVTPNNQQKREFFSRPMGEI